MTQGILPIKYESEPTSSDVTSYAGLPLYLDLSAALCLSDVMDQTVGLRTHSQGWTDSQIIQSLILLNLAGGDCVDDLNVLESDPGLNRVIKQCAFSGLTRKERRTLWQRFRKGHQRAFPSPSAVFRYLKKFHDPQAEQHRTSGKAFIPPPTAGLQALYNVNAYLIRALQQHEPQQTATLDIDATLIQSHKQEALCCYKGFRGWQPVNVLWAEQVVLLHSEFRDGNVPAQSELKRVIQKSLEFLPAGIETIYLRSDSAGYQWDFLKYLANEQHDFERPIKFAIGVDVTDSFKKAVCDVDNTQWHRLYRWCGDQKVETQQEWAEVCFVPQALATKKHGPEYRFIAIREPVAEQLILDETIPDQLTLPFPTLDMITAGSSKRFKITALVTNRQLPGEQLIRWYRERCGRGEKIHGVIKSDFAGGKMPSGLFGVNAAWWAIAVLALNLNTLMKRLVLGNSWIFRRMKAVRFHLINRAGRVIEQARFFLIRVGRSFLDLIINARSKILEINPVLRVV